MSPAAPLQSADRACGKDEGARLTGGVGTVWRGSKLRASQPVPRPNRRVPDECAHGENPAKVAPPTRPPNPPAGPTFRSRSARPTLRECFPRRARYDAGPSFKDSVGEAYAQDLPPVTSPFLCKRNCKDYGRSLGGISGNMKRLMCLHGKARLASRLLLPVPTDR
jgi:hypothetical protein